MMKGDERVRRGVQLMFFCDLFRCSFAGAILVRKSMIAPPTQLPPTQDCQQKRLALGS